MIKCGLWVVALQQCNISSRLSGAPEGAAGACCFLGIRASSRAVAKALAMAVVHEKVL